MTVSHGFKPNITNLCSRKLEISCVTQMGFVCSLTNCGWTLSAVKHFASSVSVTFATLSDPGVISANKPESFSSKLLSHRKTFSTSAPAADKTNHVFSLTPDKDNLFLHNSLEKKRSC